MLFLIVAMAVTMAPSVVKAQLDALPPELQERVEDLLATRFPPQLHEVSIDPEEPGEGDDITVTADIYNDAEVTDDETMEAYIFFSTDGGESWEEVEMETDDDKTWVGVIPGQDSGTTITWGLRAVDSSTNFYTDVPCMLSEPLPSEGYLENDCFNNDDVDCESALPMGCAFALANDEEPVDDEDDVAPPDFDFQNFRFGYDDDNFYLDLVVEGEVSEGSAAPMDIHGYAAAIVDVDKGGNSTDLESLLEAGALLVHAPLAKIAGGVVKPCFYGYQQGGDFVQDDGALDCNAEANHLIFTVSRDAIGENDTNQYQFLGANLSITGITPISGAVYDNTRVTQVSLTSRTIEVE